MLDFLNRSAGPVLICTDECPGWPGYSDEDEVDTDCCSNDHDEYSVSIGDWMAEQAEVVVVNRAFTDAELEDSDSKEDDSDACHLSLEEYKLRISRCGTFCGRTFDPYTGRVRPSRFRCGCWRSREGVFCPNCRKDRELLFWRKVKDAYKAVAHLGVVRIAHDEAGAIVGKVHKHDYLRFPIHDEDADRVIDFIIMKWDLVKTIPGAVLLSYDDILHINLPVLANTPDPLRISGSLGSPIRLVDPRSVKVPLFHIDLESLDVEAERRAMTMMFSRTANLNPKTLEELQSALEYRKDVYIQEITKEGGRLINGTRVSYIETHVEINCIDWSQGIQSISGIKDLVTCTLAGFRFKKSDPEPESG